jgi:UDP-N-acetylglucosamine/UDP-N-acetylgalactosamine 4-epimerase
MRNNNDIRNILRGKKLSWLVTGAAGFVGSHLIQALLENNQKVVGLDNFSTGHAHNIEDVKSRLGTTPVENFRFIEGDIREIATCTRACEGIDIVLHQAALGSVPRSIHDPMTCHAVNIDGTMNMLNSARMAQTSRFVFASSSSVYGDSPQLPKKEDEIGNPLSPYAASKRYNEINASVFHQCFGMQTIGLRYFNVFGPRQDPLGPYAAVIPKWLERLFSGRQCEIYGDGTTSRDFCYVNNVVLANILAATTENEPAFGNVFNVANGDQTSLLKLHEMLGSEVSKIANQSEAISDPGFKDFRPGDVRHSRADISRASSLLEFMPVATMEEGLAETVAFFAETRGSAGRVQ